MENKLQLSSLCEAIVDCEHKTAPIQPWGIPSIRTTNIKNGRIDFKNANRVSEEVYKQWTARLEPKPGDLILAREAPVGDVGIIPPNQKACLGQRTVLIRTNKEKLDSRYLLYLLLTPQMRYKMMSKSEGSTVSHLNMSDIRNLEIPKLPPLSEQKAIAHILSSFDDKIELNRQMNETLEAMARAIFKSWFVDFDPVSAKRSGRQPAGMDTATADLFPDEFEESSLGLIPKGWRVGTVSDIAIIGRDGLTPSNYPEELFNHYSIPVFDESKLPKFELGEQIKSNKYIVSQHSVLLSKLNPTIPRVWFPIPINKNRGICSTEFLVILPKKNFSKEYLYSFFTSESFFEVFVTLVTGTSGSHQRVKPNYLLEMKTLIPPQLIIMAFSKLTNALYEQIGDNLKQCQTLATLRDTLLPKLMSGEIQVKEAEKIINDKL